MFNAGWYDTKDGHRHSVTSSKDWLMPATAQITVFTSGLYDIYVKHLFVSVSSNLCIHFASFWNFIIESLLTDEYMPYTIIACPFLCFGFQLRRNIILKNNTFSECASDISLICFCNYLEKKKKN